MRTAERLFVWLGGAAFVGALAFCAWSYLVVWGAPSDVFIVIAGRVAAPETAIGVDALLFGVFAVHHSLFARHGVQRVMALALPPRLIRPLYVWTASLLLIAVCAAWVPVPGELYDHRGWLQWAHAAVQLAGVWLTHPVGPVHRRARAGGHPRTVHRGDSASHGPVPLGAASDLPRMGPDDLRRGPLDRDRLAFAAISTAYLVVAVPWEERSLVRVFGDAYVDYRRRVRWRIVPYVY